MNTAPTLICSTCNGLISAEDLAQGLAVRVDGETICPMCVDQLPGKAQVEINKLRALKGFSATTYRVLVPAHADHLRFTFTTASNIMGHYRTVHAEGSFIAPWLPEQTSVIKPKTPRPTSRSHSTATKAPSRIQVAPQPSPGRSRQVWLLVGGGVALVGLVGVAVVLFLAQGRHAPVRPAPSVTALGTTRGDYPADPFAAWLMCTTDPRCPSDLVIAIDQELRTHLATTMDQAEQQLQGHSYAAAAGLLATVHMPDDPSFTALRSRAKVLQSRLALASASPAPAPIPAPAPAPAPDTDGDTAQVPSGHGGESPAPADHAPAPSGPDGPPVDAHPAAIPVPVVAAPLPAPVAPAPTGESWMIATSDLLPPGGAIGADHQLAAGLELQRALPPVAGGNYQIWTRGGNAHAPQSALMLMIDGQLVQTLSASTASDLDWHVLAPKVALAPGSHLLQLEVVGGGWQIEGFYLGTTSYPAPAHNRTYGVPPWAETPAVAPAPPVHGSDQIDLPAPALSGQRHVKAWTPSFVWPATIRPEPMDGSSNLPTPWPAGAPPFFRAPVFSDDGPATLVLHLQKKEVQGGGLALILNPMRVDRKTLRVTLEWTDEDTDHAMSTNGHVSMRILQPLTFTAQAWQVFTITLPDLSNLPKHVRLRLNDVPEIAPDDSRGFLLGSVVTVANGKPDARDLGPLSPPLLCGDIISDQDYQQKLITILGRVAAHRRGGHPWNDVHFFNPLALQILVAGSTPSWQSAMRTRLLDLGSVVRPRNGFFQTMGLDPEWFPSHEFGHGRPVLDPEEISLGIVMLNGQEAMTPLHDPDELWNFVRRTAKGLIEGDQGHGGGLLPVFVIGATTNNPMAGQLQQISDAWAGAVSNLSDLGVPVIDIRNAQFSEADTPEQASVRLLGDGLQTLCYQLQWAQRKLHP